MVESEQTMSKAEAAPPLASTDRRRWNMKSRAAGPVALLLQSLGTAGLTIDIAGNVGGMHGSISIAHSPRHLYRSVINEAALQGTIAALHRRRPNLAPAQNIDWGPTRMLWKRATAEGSHAASQRHLLALAAGGHWRQNHLKAIEPEATDTCILCGEGRDDDEHMWTCQAMQHIRARHESHPMHEILANPAPKVWHRPTCQH